MFPPLTPVSMMARILAVLASGRISATAVLLAAMPLFAPAVVAQQSVVRIQRLGLEEGLSQSSAQALLRDHLGILWIGTQDGLNRFDGYETQVFRPDPLDERALKSGLITALHEDESGTLWVGTDGGGLSRYDRATGAFKTYRRVVGESTSLGSDVVNSISSTPDGRVWVGTAGQGLCSLRPETGVFRCLTVENSELPSDWILAVKRDVGGGLWVGSDGGGLSLLDPVSETVRSVWPDPADPALDDRVVFDVEATADGSIWLATSEGTVHLDPGSEQSVVVEMEASAPRGTAFDILAASDGRIWVGMLDGGLVVREPGANRFERFLDAEGAPGLEDDTVYSLAEDLTGGIWVGTESSGLRRIVRRSVPITSLLPGQAKGRSNAASLDVWSVLESSFGQLLVGSSDGGVSRFDLDGRPLPPLQPVAPSQGSESAGRISSMAETTDGRIWMAVSGFGLVAWSRSAGFDRYPADPGDPSTAPLEYAHSLLAGTDGSLWIGVDGGGLGRRAASESGFSWFRPGGDSLQGMNTIFGLNEGPPGTLWLGTDAGLIRYVVPPAATAPVASSGNLHRIDGLAGFRVFDVLVSDDGILWAGTDHGLFQADRRTTDAGPPSFRRFSEVDGLPNNTVYAVQPDVHGRLWMSTNRGLAALDRATGAIRTYGPEDGVPGYEFNEGAHAVGPSGRLYFGGIEGLAIVEPEADADLVPAPAIVITRVSVDGRTVASDLSAGAELRFESSERYISFEYAAVDMELPPRHKYRYRLDPLDDDWVPADDRRYTSFAHLAPGSYTFRVSAAGRSGIWSQEESTVRFVVNPAFWQTWVFRTLSLVGLFALVSLGLYGAHSSRIRRRDEQIELQRRINDRLEAERLRLARELHDGPIQQLQLTGFQLKQLSDERPDATERADELRRTILEAIGGLRNVCGELRPPALVHFGLAPAIRSHTERFLTSHPDISVTLDLAAAGDRLSERQRIALFRIYQEALNNVARHAGPCSVVASLEDHGASISMEISDDGSGFDIPRNLHDLAEMNHYGLLGAKERAQALGGTFEVRSGRGRGLTMRVEVPVGTEAAAGEDDETGF